MFVRYPKVRMIKTFHIVTQPNPFTGKPYDVIIEKGSVQWASGFGVDGQCELFSKSAFRAVWVPPEYFEVIEKER